MTWNWVYYRLCRHVKVIPIPYTISILETYSHNTGIALYAKPSSIEAPIVGARHEVHEPCRSRGQEIVSQRCQHHHPEKP